MTALPEVFEHPTQYDLANQDGETHEAQYPPGWYYWFVEPGCLPEGDPIGPFESYDEAWADANDEVAERARADEAATYDDRRDADPDYRGRL